MQVNCLVRLIGANQMLLLLLLLLLTCLTIAVDEISGEPLQLGKTKHVPRKFTDDLLPESQRSGEWVPHLGKLQFLDTFMAPKSAEEIRTTFSVFNNWHEPLRSIQITPDSWATLGRAETPYEKFGPYHFDLDALLTSGFDASQRIVVMIPGYFSPDEASWVRDARNRWLELDRDVNVIAVSWSDSNQCTYSRAVAHTVIVARQVTIFLHYLAELSGTHLQDQRFLNRIHLIGHSLGAHIAGFVGQDLGGQVGRITGLDPAGPTFDQFKRSQRLDRNDAKLVEVLHTNSGRMKYLNFLASAPLHALNSVAFIKQLSDQLMAHSYSGGGDTAWFGIELHSGHVDYFANNGRNQAGCQGLLHICDHKRARDIYVDLLNYECALRRSQSTASLVSLLEEDNMSSPDRRRLSKMNRLYAFKSPDYETFASGRNFIMNCPELMTISQHLDDEEVLKSFRKCSIPLLDFLRPVDELIEELRTVYGINFDRDTHDDNDDDGGDEEAGQLADDETQSAVDGTQESTSSAVTRTKRQKQQQSAYYFKTSADTGNLVGDHYLLKIYLLDEPVWNEDSCSLETEIVLNDGEKINLNLNQVVHPATNQRVLAMPFVHLDSSKAKDQFNNLMKLIKLVEMERADADLTHNYSPSRDFTDVFQDLFPRTIMLALAKPKATSVFGAMKDAMTIKMIKPSDELPACRLTIDMVEVHPIVYGLKRNFGALYGRNLFLGGDINQTLTVLNADDQLKRLDEANRFITTLSADSISSFGVGLEAALVG